LGSAPVGLAPPKNVFEAIQTLGHDFDFEPSREAFEPTDAVPGSKEKMEVIIDRLRRGLPLHHPEDRVDLESLSSGRAADVAARTPKGCGRHG
jgi:hypothetical protein